MKSELISMVSMALLCLVPAAAGQAAADPSYVNQNQTDPRPVGLAGVAGNIHDPGGLSFVRASISLFTEQDHTLVATVESDKSGHFSFAKIKPGLYRVVAKVEGLCPANIPVKIESFSPVHRKMQIIMQPKGLDTCSYAIVK